MGNKFILSSNIEDELKDTFGLTETSIETISKTYEEPYILEKIKFIKDTTVFKKNQINNIAGYLKSALKNDYQISTKDECEVKELPSGGDMQVILAYKENLLSKSDAIIQLCPQSIISDYESVVGKKIKDFLITQQLQPSCVNQ